MSIFDIYISNHHSISTDYCGMFMYHLVMISIDLSKTTQKKKKKKKNPRQHLRQNSVQDKIQDNFF